MNNDFDSLLKGMVDGTLSQEEQNIFEETLKNDSEARIRYLDYMAVESMLASHRVKIEHADIPKRKTIKFSTEKAEYIKTKKKKRSTSPVFLLAASLFIAFTLGYYLKYYKNIGGSQSAKPDYIAKIESLKGAAFLVIGGKKLSLTKGLEIKQSAEVEGTNDCELNLVLDDGSSIFLSPKSQISISKKNGQYLFHLKQGQLKAQVNKQAANKAMVIKTPKAGIIVLGTTLRLGVNEVSTILTVDEGRVEIKDENNESLIVKTNEVAVAEAGKPLRARNISEYKLKSLNIIRAQYGADNKWVDVTSHIRSITGNSRLIPTGPFVHFAGDPNYLVVKELKIDYIINGQKASAAFNEYTNVDARIVRTEIVLPKP